MNTMQIDENEHIESRYGKLVDELEQQYPEIFHRSLEVSFTKGGS